jgi:hypothetical protein
VPTLKPIYSLEQFHAALAGEDELGVVLRSHFYIEAELEAFIDSLIPNPNSLPRLKYEQKIKLACALGLHTSVVPPLKALGDLRNSFGHQIGAHLTVPMLNKMHDSFVPEDQESIRKGYDKTRAEIDTTLPPMEDLGPKDRFVLLSIALHKILTQVVSEVRPISRT